MSSNGISHLQYKRQRQEQKLKLAAEKRAATGKRSTLKKGLMPTLYTAGDNDTANVFPQDGAAQNVAFETLGDNFIDFTESNPFGDPSESN